MHTFGKANLKFVLLTLKCPEARESRDVTTSDYHGPLPRPLSLSLFNREKKNKCPEGARDLNFRQHCYSILPSIQWQEILVRTC